MDEFLRGGMLGLNAQREAERVKQDNRTLEERVRVLEKRLREVRILLGLQ